MLLAGLWFDKPTLARIVAVAVLFTLGWLVEWRLIFPALPGCHSWGSTYEEAVRNAEEADATMWHDFAQALTNR